MTEREPETAEQRLARYLAQGSAVLAAHDQDDLNQGQISGRVLREDRFLIKRAARAFAEATPSDMVEVDVHADDRSLPRLAPPETALHQAIYDSRPDVGAIVHTHAANSLIFGAFDDELRPLSHDGAWFDGALARFTMTSQTILDIGVARAVAEALGDGRAVLLRNHGSIVVGQSVRDAVVGSIVLERACELQLRARAIGSDWHYSDSVDVKAKQEFNWSPGAVRTYWESLVRLAPACNTT